MTDRKNYLIGTGAALVWSIALIWIGSTMISIPPFSRILVQPFFTLAPGLVLLAMIAAVAIRRWRDPERMDGGPPVPGSRLDIDLRVLRNTLEQAVLAVCLWPPLSYILLSNGLGVVMALSVGFALARLAYWVGYHYSAPLRAFGFGATFYPTVLAMLWGLILRVF